MGSQCFQGSLSHGLLYLHGPSLQKPEVQVYEGRSAVSIARHPAVHPAPAALAVLHADSRHGVQLRPLLDRRTPGFPAKGAWPASSERSRKAHQFSRRQTDLRGYLTTGSIRQHPGLLRKLRLPSGNRPRGFLRRGRGEGDLL